MKGYRFMCNGNIVYYSAQALFDEELFPRCKTQSKCLTTRVSKPRVVQPPPVDEDALPGPPGPLAQPVPWDNFGNEMHCPKHSSQRAPPSAPAPLPLTHPPPAQPMVTVNMTWSVNLKTMNKPYIIFKSVHHPYMGISLV